MLFCLVNHHFRSFWLFVALCPFILAFFLCLHLLPHRRFVALFAFMSAFCFILAFCSFISFYFGFLWLHLLFIFGLLWLHLLAFWLLCGFISFNFWLFVALLPFILASLWLHFLSSSMFLPMPVSKIAQKHRVFGGFGLLAMPKLVKKRRVFALYECSAFQKLQKTHGFLHFFCIHLFKKG